jgi:2-dehydropantoate 2-reductase
VTSQIIKFYYKGLDPMGQVPTEKQAYGIVGNGKMASHLKRYFELTNTPYIQWTRKDHANIPIQKHFEKATYIFVLISDDHLDSFISTSQWPSKSYIIHFSGSRTINDAFALHPLMTFSDKTYHLETYKTIPFIQESDGFFNKVFPHFNNPAVTVSREDKALYHALCVFTGNLTTIIWQEGINNFSKELNIEKEILFPYMNQIVRNLQEDFNNSLTGPLERKDMTTISSNISSLSSLGLDEIFKSFVKRKGIQNEY